MGAGGCGDWAERSDGSDGSDLSDLSERLERSPSRSPARSRAGAARLPGRGCARIERNCNEKVVRLRKKTCGDPARHNANRDMAVCRRATP